MYLKKLEIQGFKSFPDKIRLEFSHGITAVVGPNGSGKSNISDAIRWVLGEQSAKALRGGKMEDVIFAGTAARRAVGFAEVSMTLDNSDGKLACEYTEVTVTRRMFRSGDGQFFINGTACRLKDIHALFMDTGIGRDGYSIIGQGQIDSILNAKSEERRVLFEEAAGIIKYKTRKHEAEENLEKENRNLERVNDILAELEKNYAPLQKAAEKAKQFISLSERLKIVKTNIFIKENTRLEKEIETQTQSENALSIQIQDEETKRAETRQHYERTQEEIESMTFQIEKLSDTVREFEVNAQKLQADIKISENTILRLNEDCENLSAKIESNIVQKLSDEKISLEKLLTTQKNTAENKKCAVIDAETEYENLSVSINELSHILEQYSSKHIENLNANSELKAKLERGQAIYETLENQRENAGEDANKAEQSLKDAQQNVNSIESEFLNAERSFLSIKQKCAATEAEKQKEEQNFLQVNAKFSSLKRVLEDLRSRLKWLTELEHSHEGYYKSVKTVLAAKEKSPERFAGIIGAVGELLSVEENYEIAIEIALGGTIDNIVTKNETDAAVAIQYLKETKAGRATFMPLTAVKGNGISGEKFSGEKGFLSVADKVVLFDKAYEKIFENLLGKTLVFDTIANAVEFSKKYKYSFRCVTLEGEIINAGGSITGGSAGKNQSGILSRAREISVLKEQVAEQEKSALDLQYEVSEKENVLRSLNDMFSSYNANARQLELKLTQTKSQLERSKDIAKNAESAIHAAKQKIVDLNEKLNSQNKLIRTMKAELKESQDAIAEILKENEQLTKNLTKIRKERDKKAEQVSAARLELLSAENDVTRTTERITAANSEIQDKKLQVKNSKEQLEVLRMKIEEEKKKTISLKEQIENIKKEADTYETRSAQVVALREKLKTGVKHFDENDHDAEYTISELSKERVRTQMKHDRLQEERRRLFDEIWDEYEISLQSALKEQQLTDPVWKLQREEKTIKEEIRTLGNVNTNAADEFRELSERLKFITEQRKDIIDAEEKLRKIIGELTDLMKARFSERLHEISKNFGEAFSAMFGGGTASLKLSDESDALNSGVEISAQMPGKNLKSMSLFSGGERALTAIALLFGILKINPSPFCILDEIEAALDDANVGRFANFLKALKDIQFIVITHRKGTMEAADVLYGVTMQEFGISKLVSVSFEEVAI